MVVCMNDIENIDENISGKLEVLESAINDMLKNRMEEIALRYFQGSIEGYITYKIISDNTYMALRELVKNFGLKIQGTYTVGDALIIQMREG